MNRAVTSREAILATCKELFTETGAQALNMRDVAKKCGVAIGSVYNYFSSKENLTTAIVESIWTDIMHQGGGVIKRSDFIQTVRNLFERIERGSKEYPFFISAHSASFANMDKTEGRDVMNRYFQHIESGLLEALDGDPRARPDAFNEELTQKAFVGFVFSNVMAQVMARKTDCDTLIAVIKRTIY